MPYVLSENVSNSLDINNMFGYNDYNTTVNNSTQIPETESSRSDGSFIVVIVIASCVCCFCFPFICDNCSKCCDNLECYCLHDTFKLCGNMCFDMLGCMFCNWPVTSEYCNDNGTGHCNEIRCCCRSYFSRDCFSRIYSRLCPYSCRCEKKEPQTTQIENLFEIVVTQPVDRSNFCVICHEDFGKGKHAKLECGHKFHKKCIEEWLSVSAHKDCPVCRHPV